MAVDDNDLCFHSYDVEKSSQKKRLHFKVNNRTWALGISNFFKPAPLKSETRKEKKSNDSTKKNKMNLVLFTFFTLPYIFDFLLQKM
jgi:hypothetical protein